MKSKMIALLLLAGGSLFAQTRFSLGVGIGAPGYYPAPAAGVVASRPPYPGPGYQWVDGYYGPNGGWIAGYWAAPRYDAAPRYYAPAPGYYYGGSSWRGRDWDRDRDHQWREQREEREEHEGGWRR